MNYEGTINEINEVSDRNYGIDFLRILSMIMIPILHILSHGGVLAGCNPLSLQYNLFWFLEILCYGAVDIFGIVSGYVMSDRKIKYSNLLLLWMRVFFYSVIIAGLYYIFNTSSFDIFELIKYIFPTMFSRNWYWTCYFGLFLLLPIINIGIKNINTKSLCAITFIILIFYSVFSTVLFQNDIFQLSNGYSTLWLIVLYFIGAIIKRFENEKKSIFKKNIAYLLAYFVSCLLTFLSKIGILIVSKLIFGEYKYSDCFVSYLSPFVLISAISLVVYFSNRIFTNRFAINCISFFSPLAFSVYLIHDNLLLRDCCISGHFSFLLDVNGFWGIILTVSFALLIFISCSLVDVFRALIFEKIKIKEKLQIIERKIKDKIERA